VGLAYAALEEVAGMEALPISRPNAL
jgi:hypothetical protein